MYLFHMWHGPQALGLVPSTMKEKTNVKDLYGVSMPQTFTDIKGINRADSNKVCGGFNSI